MNIKQTARVVFLGITTGLGVGEPQNSPAAEGVLTNKNLPTIGRSTNAPAKEEKKFVVDAEAMDRYEFRASIGDVNAMAVLVQVHGKGLFEGKVNHKEAFKWAREAYDSGTSVGVSALATCVKNGWGTPANAKDAAELEKRAAELKIKEDELKAQTEKKR